MTVIGACVKCGGEYTATSERRAVKNGRKCIVCRRAYTRLWRQERKHGQVGDQWRAELAEKARRARVGAGVVIKAWARRQVAWALSKGVLVEQPCERCGNVRVEAHHENYWHPLDVRWLCAVCHAAEHQADGAVLELREVITLAQKVG